MEHSKILPSVHDGNATESLMQWMRAFPHMPGVANFGGMNEDQEDTRTAGAQARKSSDEKVARQVQCVVKQF